MIDIIGTSEGCVLPVKAQPGARKNGIQGIQAGALKVAVTVAPEHGKANQALIVVLAKELGLKKSQITLQSGATSREKKFLVQGISEHDLQKCLEQFFQV